MDEKERTILEQIRQRYEALKAELKVSERQREIVMKEPLPGTTVPQQARNLEAVNKRDVLLKKEALKEINPLIRQLTKGEEKKALEMMQDVYPKMGERLKELEDLKPAAKFERGNLANEFAEKQPEIQTDTAKEEPKAAEGPHSKFMSEYYQGRHRDFFEKEPQKNDRPTQKPPEKEQPTAKEPRNGIQPSKFVQQYQQRNIEKYSGKAKEHDKTQEKGKP